MSSVAMPLAFVLIWSTGFIVAKFAAGHAPPLTFLAWRFGAAIVVMGAFAWATRAPWPRQLLLWLHVAVAGLLLQALYLGGVWFAVARGVPAGVSALIVGAQPLATAALAFTVGERVVLRQGIGLFAPPFGVGYYAACAIGKVNPDEGMRPIVGYLLALAVGISMVAAFPWFSIGFL